MAKGSTRALKNNINRTPQTTPHAPLERGRNPTSPSRRTSSRSCSRQSGALELSYLCELVPIFNSKIASTSVFNPNEARLVELEAPKADFGPIWAPKDVPEATRSSQNLSGRAPKASRRPTSSAAWHWKPPNRKIPYFTIIKAPKRDKG